MKYKKIIILSIYFFLIYGRSAYAQQGPVSAGGEATGGGGTASYSVGQVDYTVTDNGTGNAHQGLQQPREFFTTSILELGSIGINALVFPNPSKGDVTLNVQNMETSNMRYTLFNTQGQQLGEGPLTGTYTAIDMNSMAAGAYFLRLNIDNKSIKIFKIIKQ